MERNWIDPGALKAVTEILSAIFQTPHQTSKQRTKDEHCKTITTT